MIITVLGGLAVLTAFGLAVLTLVISAQRSLLLPAAPLLGAAYLVVVLHLTGLFLPVVVGIWVAVGLAAAAIVVSLFRNRSVRIGRLSDWRDFALVLAIGAIGAAIALLPSFLANSSLVVQPGLGNDAFYYVSVSKWLAVHPISEIPDIGTSPLTGADSPVFGPAFDSLDLSLRLGQEMIQAGLSTLTGIPLLAGFSPWLGMWVLLGPSGAWVVGAAFGLSRWGRLALGGILATSASLMNQVVNQNADSLLGIAFVPLLVGVVVLALTRDEDRRRVPLWVAALVLSATIGTYTEYIPFLVLILGALVLLRPLAQLKAAFVGAAAIVGLAVAIAPVAWIRAAQSTLFLGTVTVGGGEVVLTPLGLTASFLGGYRAILLGQDPANVGLPTFVGVTVMFSAALAGAILTLGSARTRSLGIGVALSGAVALYIAARGNPYITSRAVDLITPFIIIVAVLGWSNLVKWLSGCRPRVIRVVAVLGVAALTAGIMLTAARVSVRHVMALWDPDRSVSDDHVEAATWLREVGGEDGRKVSVAVATLFDQLWLSEAASDLPDLSFVNLRGDLGYRSNPNLDLASYWDGERDRYILAGPGAYSLAGEEAVVESNDTYRLLDLSRTATVVVPVGSGWQWNTDDSGQLSGWRDADLQIITGSAELADVALRISGVSASTRVSLFHDGRTVASVVSDGSDLSFPLDGVAVADGRARVSIEVSSANGQDSVTLEGLTSE